MAQITVPSFLTANAGLTTSSRGCGAIAVFEGVVLRAYPDPGTGAQPWTIGIGHTSRAGAPIVTRGMTITRDQAFAILATDLHVFEQDIKSLVKVALQPNEFDALSSFVLNIGTPNFRTSSTLRLLNAGDKPAAADAMLAWNKANGHVLGGLVTRRAAERQIFLASYYPAGTPTVTANNAGQIANGVLLVRGCTHPDAVRALQTDLNALGMTLAVDGDFGAATEAAVRRFQSAHDLTVDGQVGPATRAAIAAALKAMGKAPVVALHPLPGDAITALAA